MRTACLQCWNVDVDPVIRVTGKIPGLPGYDLLGIIVRFHILVIQEEGC